VRGLNTLHSLKLTFGDDRFQQVSCFLPDRVTLGKRSQQLNLTGVLAELTRILRAEYNYNDFLLKRRDFISVKYVQLSDEQTCRRTHLISCCGVKSLGHDLISKDSDSIRIHSLDAFCLENCQGGLFLSLACCMNQKSRIIICVGIFYLHFQLRHV